MFPEASTATPSGYEKITPDPNKLQPFAGTGVGVGAVLLDAAAGVLLLLQAVKRRDEETIRNPTAKTEPHPKGFIRDSQNDMDDGKRLVQPVLFVKVTVRKG